MFLDRDKILSAEDLKTEVVTVKEWGGDVMVRAMTGKERDSWEESLRVEKNGRWEPKLDNVRTKLLVKTIVDPETMKPLFKTGDIDALSEKNAAPLDKLFAVAQRLSGITETDVEELEKN